jgi:hypothetical protein
MWSKFICQNDACHILKMTGKRNEQTNLSAYKRKKCNSCGKMMKKE